MSVAEIFERIESAQEEKRRENYRAYKDLLTDLAAGNEVDAAEVSLVLQMMDLSRSELESDLKSFQDRLALIKHLETVRVDDATVQAADAEYNQAVVTHMQESQRLLAIVEEKNNTLRRLLGQQAQAIHLEDRIQRSCTDPDIAARERKYREHAAELGKQRQAVMESIDPAKHRLRDAIYRRDRLATIQKTKGLDSKEKAELLHWEEQVETFQRELDGLEREKAKVERMQAEHGKVYQQIQQEKLAP